MFGILTAITAMCALLGVTIVLLRPHWAFLLITVMFALEQLLQSYFTYLQNHPSLFNYAVAVVAALAVTLRMMRREPVFSGLYNPVTFLVFAQFALWTAGIIYSPAPEVARAAFDATLPYLVLYLLVLPLVVLDIVEFRKFLVGMMVVGSVMALLIILNPRTSYYSGRLMLDLGMSGDPMGKFGSPLAIAELGGTVGLVAALIVPPQRRALFTMLRVAAFILGLGLAIGSGSRGQVLAMVIAGIIFYPMARRLNSSRNFILTALGLLVLAGGIVLTFQLFIGEQNRERWDAGQMLADIALRFDMCAKFVQLWLSSPAHWLFGLGTNAWTQISGVSNLQGNYVHNVAVEILCEQGVVGAAIFGAATVLTIRAGVRLWVQHYDDPPMRSAAAILLAISAFALFNALKQGSIVAVAPFYWWLVMAKIARHEELLMPADDIASNVQPASVDLEYGAQPDYAAAP